MNNAGIRVLVVDDDDAKRYTLSRLLRQEGFAVQEAIDGRTALEASQSRPDLIVLDVKLPDISGVEVCRMLKSQPATARIPVLHISGALVGLEDRIHGLDSGAEAYLTDAVNASEFVATVRALLRAREAGRALREAEERFQLLVRSVREYAIFMCDPTGEITNWNEGVERIFGYGREGFIRRPYRMLSASPEEAETDLRTARQNGYVEYERWHERGDGSRFFANGNITAVYDDAERLVGFTAIVRDVTERRTAEEERIGLLAREQQARRDAEQANRLKDEFLATLSHELRTPLMAILGWAQLLQTGKLSGEEVREGVAVIERNARAQAQLIEDLLDVSRIISGKLRLRIERVEIAPIIQAAVESIRPAADAKKISLRLDAEPNLGPVTGDPARLQQVLWNLLSNAIKFTPKEGQVTLKMINFEGGLEITVTDTGEGIDPEFLPHVFDRFRQADATAVRTHSGLGLGLAIVRHLIEMHGGTVQATSAGRGRGATFTVRLPPATEIEPVKALSDEPVLASDGGVGIQYPNLRGVHVLIVEDEADARDVLGRIIRQCGGEASLAANAEEGMEEFSRRPPDLLISDIGMPGEDGYSFIRRIRGLEAGAKVRIPAVALTAFARSDDRRRALAAGFQVHMAKPVNPSELMNVVATLTGRLRRQV